MPENCPVTVRCHGHCCSRQAIIIENIGDFCRCQGGMKAVGEHGPGDGRGTFGIAIDDGIKAVPVNRPGAKMSRFSGEKGSASAGIRSHMILALVPRPPR